jgi:hypothetical protein
MDAVMPARVLLLIERAGRTLAYCSRTGHVGKVKEQGGGALSC